MKKPIFLFVLAFSLGGLAPAGGLTSLGAADDSGATFGESEAANFVSFFNGIYSYDATVTGYEFSGYPTTFAISQEIAPDAQITRVGLTLTAGETTTGGDISYIYGVRGEDGNAYVRSLSTSNTTYDTAVTDSDGNAVAFKTAYPTFFDGLLTVSPAAFGTYFDAVRSGEGYTVTPTSLGLARLSAGLDSFLLDIVPYAFDAKSHSVSYLDLAFEVDSEGVPTSLSFDRLDLDRFGGLRGHYEVDLAALEAVSDYDGATPTLSPEDESLLQGAFDQLETAMAGGNFTENISIVLEAQGQSIPLVSYANYYDLTGIGLMLSSMSYQESSNGLTYTGMWSGEEGSYFIPVAISPETDTFATTIGSDESQIFHSIGEAVPTIGNLSTDFFEREGETFAYDIEGELYADYAFQMELLCDLFGTGDYYSRRDSYSLYQVDTTNYELNFHRLEASIDGEGYPAFTMTFDSWLGYELTAYVSFSSFGTTDLASVEDEDGNALFADALSVYELYGRIPTFM